MGTYAESLLTPDERVLRRERQHPVVLVLDSWSAIILWVATIVLLVARVAVPDEVAGRNLFGDDTWFGQAGSALVLLTLLGGVIVVAVRWWWWRTQEFLVTNRRLVLAWGVLNKASSDSSLEKINDAQLEISVLGRLLDYGTLKVMTAAPMAGSDYLDRLHHAKEFKKTMMTAKHELQTGGGSGDGEDYARALRSTAIPAGAQGAAAAEASGTRADTPEEVTALLEQLGKLRDEGHISTAEYESKKQELLGRL